MSSVHDISGLGEDWASEIAGHDDKERVCTCMWLTGRLLRGGDGDDYQSCVCVTTLPDHSRNPHHKTGRECRFWKWWMFGL